ncbi:carbohydrate ABC transporter permease [Heyndrickxia oleronia]|uniref:carbohydrate ABC transporter permease n=1 Tax=Heyndrickxia sp. FSL W8-0496 TaxID=2954702 RepID=UPI00191C8B17|nr:carbohydrate ABC transporter permease [Heyndrickxia oleronia]MBU5213012.1 carbohydrate ABC transporter permease [Heyndrickxia oleronia]MCM3452518.1 carbohydrate ABC transporter permease [Heyndrickxia oleronia]
MGYIKKYLGWLVKYGSLLIGAAIAIIPVLVVVIGSFKSKEEFLKTGVLELPKSFSLENYITAFVDGQMLTGFRNTLFIFIVSIVGKLLLGTMIAYVLNRFDFKLKKGIMALFLIATLIPAITTQVATFQIINGLGLFNSIWSVIVLNLGTDVIAVYIFLQYLEGIPVSLDEAAILEGASYFQIYRKIILPLLKAPMITVLIISGVGIYNDFYNPFLYMPDPSLKVISTALFAFKGPYGTNWPVILAGVMIVILPILIVFLVLQKYIYNGVSGSVK